MEHEKNTNQSLTDKNNKIDELTGILEEKIQEAFSLESRLKEEIENKRIHEEEKEQKQKENSNILNKIAEVEIEREELKNQLQLMNQEIILMQEQKKKIDLENSNNQSVIQELSLEKEKLSKLFGEKENECSQLKIDIESLSKEKIDVIEEKQKLMENLKKSNNDEFIEKMKVQHAMDIQQFTQKIKELEDNFEKGKIAFEQEKSDLFEKNEKLESSLNNLKQESIELEEKLRNTIQNLEDLRNQAETKSFDFDSKLDEITRNLKSEYETKIINLNSQKEIIENELHKKNTELEELKNDICILKENQIELEKSYNLKFEEKQRLLEETQTKFAIEKKESDVTIQELKNIIDECNERQSLKNNKLLMESSDSADSTEKENQELKEKIKELNDNIEIIKNDLEKAENEKKTIEHLNSNLKIELNEKFERIAKLEENVQKISQESKPEIVGEQKSKQVKIIPFYD